jgi:hypothetical protein
MYELSLNMDSPFKPYIPGFGEAVKRGIDFATAAT